MFDIFDLPIKFYTDVARYHRDFDVLSPEDSCEICKWANRHSSDLFDSSVITRVIRWIKENEVPICIWSLGCFLCSKTDPPENLEFEPPPSQSLSKFRSKF